MSRTPELRQHMADALRMLVVDAVERAGSGHPGAPMGWPTWRRHRHGGPTASRRWSAAAP